jgi:hypothetical protein
VNLKDTPAWRWGQAAETALARAHVAAGYGVVLTSNIEMPAGGAPCALNIEGARLVLPDSQVFRMDKGLRWRESKYKRGPGYMNIHQAWVHGIDLPNWNAYLDIETKSRCPVDLCLIEMTRDARRDDLPFDPRLLIQTISELQKLIRQVIQPGVHQHCLRGMVLWNRSSFEDVGPIPVDLPIDLLPEKAKIWGLTTVGEVKPDAKMTSRVDKVSWYDKNLPELADLLEKYGRYDKIPREVWAAHDKAVADYQAHARRRV